MASPSQQKNTRKPGEPAPRRNRNSNRRSIGKGTLDLNRSSKAFRLLMENISQELMVSKFVDCDRTNRKTKRRNGRAKLKKFGDKQRTLYKMIVDEVSVAYPVYSSGTQPAHDFLHMYNNMSPTDYSAFYSAFREHTYKTARVYGWDLNEQVKLLTKFGLHTTVNIILDIDRLVHSEHLEERRRGREVHNLLMLHYHYLLMILNHRTYAMLLEPITYDRLDTIKEDIVQSNMNGPNSIDDLLGNNLRINMDEVARSQQWLSSGTQQMD